MDNFEQTSQQQETFLDKVYGLAINGIPKVDKPIAQLVAEYKSKTNRQKMLSRNL